MVWLNVSCVTADLSVLSCLNLTIQMFIVQIWQEIKCSRIYMF